MGYPTYARGLRSVCMRVTRLKPVCIVEQRGDAKSVRVLVSELNPPICALIREMAQGGTKGSVPITFSSTATMARVCPPKPCDCKPCPTPFQRLLRRIILASKLIFLGGCILFMWYIGGLGPTMDTWNLKECIKNFYFACKNIRYEYKDKCNPEDEEDKGPICYDTQIPWNRAVISFFRGLNIVYFMLRDKLLELLNYESCEYEEKKKPAKEEKEEKEKKEAKPDYSKIYRSLFSSLDPINIPCDEPRDYFTELIESLRDEEEEAPAPAPAPS